MTWAGDHALPDDFVPMFTIRQVAAELQAELTMAAPHGVPVHVAPAIDGGPLLNVLIGEIATGQRGNVTFEHATEGLPPGHWVFGALEAQADRLAGAPATFKVEEWGSIFTTLGPRPTLLQRVTDGFRARRR